MDVFTSRQRSTIMSKIRSTNTRPELVIRNALWKKGLRYRIHDKSIIGTPDVSNKSKKIAIFIDGCFWHGCPTCYNKPQSNTVYWNQKLRYNKNRRNLVKKKLHDNNWKILEFWECNITDNIDGIVSKICKAFSAGSV